VNAPAVVPSLAAIAIAALISALVT